MEGYRDSAAVREILKGADCVRTLSDVHHTVSGHAAGSPIQELKILYRSPAGLYILHCRFFAMGAPEERVLALPAGLEPDSCLSYESEHPEQYSRWSDMEKASGVQEKQ